MVPDIGIEERWLWLSYQYLPYDTNYDEEEQKENLCLRDTILNSQEEEIVTVQQLTQIESEWQNFMPRNEVYKKKVSRKKKGCMIWDTYALQLHSAKDRIGSWGRSD